MFSRFPHRACFIFAGLIALAPVGRADGPGEATGAPVASGAPAPQLVDNRIELSATTIAPTSNAVSRVDGQTPVLFLNDSVYLKDPKAGGFAEWKFETPLPAGWWHGVAESTLTSERYANREIGFALISEQSKTAIPFAPHNYRGGPKGTRETFEFWMYAPAPFSKVRYEPTTDLYRWNDTWPLAKLTLEHKEPGNFAAGDAISVVVPVKDGAVQPPDASLPAGSYWLSGTNRKAGTAVVTTQDGKSLTLPYKPDRYGRPLAQTRYFFLNSPIEKISFAPKDLFTSVAIQHKRSAPFVAPVLQDTQPLMTLFDEKKPQTATLELTGTNLDGTAPAFATFPAGKKIAVVTSWDDGNQSDLRLAPLLQKHGFHPTFFFNNNSAMMAEAAKFEEMGAEVGSHGYGHPFLYQITPAEADFHMIEQRRALEAKLGHPVISMAYPNGYSAAYDVNGDYIVAAVQKAGYLSGRTTAVADLNINTMGDMLRMDTNGFFGYGPQLVENYEKRKDTEGAIFYVWGHSWQIGKTDKQWDDLEKLMTNFADNPEAWYATQGDLSLWSWMRNHTKMEVAASSPTTTKITVTRPGLHPWLANRVPLALKVPANVTQVKWQGQTLEVRNGMVDLPWPAS